MNQETLKYKSEIAMRNYGIVFGILIAVTAVLMYLGNPITLILLKLAVVPLFFLSFGGLAVIYRSPIMESKLTARSIEYFLLEALLILLFIFVVLWESSRSVAEIFGIFLMSFAAIGIIKFSMLVLAVKRTSEYQQESN